MIIYPAIDLRAGKVVRLREGDLNQETVFSAEPITTAKAWIDQGARWIHMVNLDGAFSTANENLRVLEAVANLDVNVQYGGGLRDREAIRSALNAGAARAVIGTMALKNPQNAVEAAEQHGGESICVALDAKDGVITTHGWTELSDSTPTVFGAWLHRRGLLHALYTDVKRDGMMSGVNITDTIALARATSLRVIASGGLSSLSDIAALAQSGVVAGAVIGMALYQNKFSLSAALNAAKGGG